MAMTQIEIEVDGKKYRVNAEPIEEPWVPKVGQGVRAKEDCRSQNETPVKAGTEAEINNTLYNKHYCDGKYVDIKRADGRHVAWPIASLEPIPEKVVPEKTWGVDPNGSYVKGVTRFEVKAAGHGVDFKDGATAIYSSPSDAKSLFVDFECETRFGATEYNSGKVWSIPRSALRLIEPLATPKPKDLQEWARQEGHTEMSARLEWSHSAVEEMVSKCTKAHGGRMFKRAKAGEAVIFKRVNGCDWVTDDADPFIPSIRLATFPATVSREQVEECLRLISPYLNSITA